MFSSSRLQRCSLFCEQSFCFRNKRTECPPFYHKCISDGFCSFWKMFCNFFTHLLRCGIWKRFNCRAPCWSKHARRAAQMHHMHYILMVLHLLYYDDPIAVCTCVCSDSAPVPSVVDDLRAALSRLECRVAVLEKPPASVTAAPLRTCTNVSWF